MGSVPGLGSFEFGVLCKNLAIHAAFCNFATVANLDMQFFSTCAIEQLDHFCFSTLDQKFPLTMENFFS